MTPLELTTRDKAKVKAISSKMLELVVLLENEGSVHREYIMHALNLCSPDTNTLIEQAIKNCLAQSLADGRIACLDYGSINWLRRKL